MLTGEELKVTAMGQMLLFLRIGAVVLSIVASGLPLACGRPPLPAAKPELLSNQSVSFSATFQPEAFRRPRGMPGYHLIVWKDGGSADSALFKASVNDRDLLKTLEQQGLRPGNNLTMDSWARRKDPNSSAPDLRAAGPKIAIEIVWPDGSSQAVHELFEGKKPADFDFRFTGSEALIDIWKSGCISCLYSCPGGKVVNAAYTIRDYTKKKARFQLKSEFQKRAGERVKIVLKKR